MLAGREPGLPGCLRRHGDREGHRAAPARGGVTGALRGDVTRAPASRLAAAAARLSWPPPVPDPCAGAVPGLPHSLQGPPCARSSADVPGSAPSPPRSDSASAACARPRRLPSASPASPRGREQRAAPAAMRGECASARPGRVPPELPASPLTPGHPPASFSAPLSSPQARPRTDGACSARGRLQGPRFLPPPRDVRPARPGPPLQNRDVQLGSGGVWGAFGGFF